MVTLVNSFSRLTSLTDCVSGVRILSFSWQGRTRPAEVSGPRREILADDQSPAESVGWLFWVIRLSMACLSCSKIEVGKSRW